MKVIINVLQVAVSLILIVVIMLQNRGTDVGVAFGGTSQSYRSKKGLEKFLFYATIVLAALFASLSILAVLI